MHDDLTDLTRQSLRQALERSEDDLEGVLETFGWRALAETDEGFAFTALFEELGSLPFGSDALDVVSAAFLPLSGPASIIWPVGRVSPGATGSWRRPDDRRGGPAGPPRYRADDPGAAR